MSPHTVAMSYPLSPMQQGMLFHHLSDRDSGVDIQQIVCALPEALEESRFRDAWSRVVARHAALRTSFRWEQVDQPAQVVRARVDVPVSFTDWRGIDAIEEQARLEAFLDEDRRRGFDAAQAPLLRVRCFRLADARSICVWTFHHLVCDGRSCATVLQEVFGAYEALRRGVEPRFDPARPYAEFIHSLSGRDRAREERFWRETLQDFREPTPLPGAQRPVRGARAGAVGECTTTLTATVTSTLNELATRHHLSLSTILQGAWAIVLSRYGDTEDVLFGVTRAGRGATSGGADGIVGVFINTLPARVRVRPEAQIISWLQELRTQQVAQRQVEHTPLAEVQRLSGVRPGVALFESLFLYDRQSLDTALRSQGGSWAARRFRVVEKTGLPLTFNAFGEPECLLRIGYDENRFARGAVERMLGHLRAVLEAIAVDPDRSVGQLPLLPDGERRQQLVDWNATEAAYPRDRCVHELIEEQVDRAPGAVALVCRGDEVTYEELDARANRLAHYLRTRGVGPEVLVGICAKRSIDMVVSVLATLKAGGAYVPLDPAYPKRRTAFILDDSQIRVLVTQASLARDLPPNGALVVTLDTDRAAIDAERSDREPSTATSANLAYVIYTSGSTGKPKGVMVEHRNVVNFFTGMDAHLSHDPPGAWLAVTSLSFDISVLELLWTLARGFKVVIHADELHAAGRRPPIKHRDQTIEFSLFYFSSDEGGQGSSQKYRLLTEGAKFADENGFAAVWTPERHFHAFGGLYPNPSVTSAAIAVLTTRVQIRAGSCVLPLHHPVRVAEEWSLIDNLSNGRVGIAFASGWQPNDFVLMPEHYASAKEIMVRGIGVVQRLWRGETVALPGPSGAVDVRTYPRPVQPELPFWIASSSDPQSFRLAGEMGGNVLTHLLGQTVNDLADKVEVYRQAWKRAGHAGDGHVTLMLHTFVADSEEFVRACVHEPLKAYLRSAAHVMGPFGPGGPAAGKTRREAAAAAAPDVQGLSDADLDTLLEHAFARYYETSGLFGTPASCLSMVDKLKEIGVNEIACLVDFGVPADTVLAHLRHLNQLRELANGSSQGGAAGEHPSIAALIQRHAITHLQCTPSLATTLTTDDETREALRSLRQMLVGGEPLSTPLARDLRSLVRGDVINMYGPTETTIWSSAHVVRRPEGKVPIGRPIANTEFYVLDASRQPTAIGIPGELYVGGHGVARGYLHRPELTAERFVGHPFRADTGERLYRTGDVVRYREDGAIEFLGRNDEQVKVLGHRIELGEIESVLVQHPGVREAVVVARENGSGGAQLVAYCVPVPGAAPTDADLRRHVTTELPTFMVPAVFVTLAALPRTPNGKLNRGALPAPEPIGVAPHNGFVAPRSPVEQALAAIWSAVLGLERVGRHDNFFALGGHSLATIQIVARVRRTFHVELSLQALFDAPTVADLAATLERDLANPARPPAASGAVEAPAPIPAGRA